MKRLSDLTAYKGVLPYASEIYGVYQPLLGWKSKRVKGRIDQTHTKRKTDFIVGMSKSLLPDYEIHFDIGENAIQISHIASASIPDRRDNIGTVMSEVAQTLPAHDKLTPQVWDALLQPKILNKYLTESVVPRVVAAYNAKISQVENRGSIPIVHVGAPIVKNQLTLAPQKTEAVTVLDARDYAKNILAVESQVAGLLNFLRDYRHYDVLEAIFYPTTDSPLDKLETLKNLLYSDPFDTIDPSKQLDRVGLSPVGVAHLFREYFFELDSFLGPPIGHVWLSPGATVELYEVHTRRTRIEQTQEQSTQTTTKSETSTTQEDDLADAVKSENENNTKLGVSASSSQNWGWGKAGESASFDLANTQKSARENTHKTMRQQSTKLSTEITQNFKTTFRTVTDTTDTSSKRYVLANTTDKLINYELRRKYRQLAIQVQDIASYLCWQTYVDDPGEALGLARMVHVGVPPDLSSVPNPNLIVPDEAFDEPHTLTIPFDGSGDTDVDYDDGNEVGSGLLDTADHIVPDIQFPPFQCSKAGYKLTSVSIDPGGNNAVLTVDPKSITASTTSADSYSFTVHLQHINFEGQGSIAVNATLHWEPTQNRDDVTSENKKRVGLFTARERQIFEKAFLDEAQARIKAASNITVRPSEDLRDEERIVVYRQLILELLAPPKIISQPDAQSHHIVSELIDSIFDVDKLLYFVSPEWWRPRKRRNEQTIGGFDPVYDSSDNLISLKSTSIPKDDLFDWDRRGDPKYSRNYYITEDSTPARFGSSLGWVLQLDGDPFRNAFLNAPWVKAVLPIRPGKERAALNWLQQVEGTNGIGPNDLYEGPEVEWHGQKTVLEVLLILADQIEKKHEQELETQSYTDPLDGSNTVSATPVDRVFETGFDPLQGGFRANVSENFEPFDQWLEILPTDQAVAVEVAYDSTTGRQVPLGNG